jgi:radical SAM protein with 4Fe4S-binding SPASM domain
VKLRAEAFGALVELDRPAAVVAVNQRLAQLLGLPHSKRWSRPSATLSAPIEAQLQLSKRCGAGCSTCFVGATPRGAVMELRAAKEAIDRLAEKGVFRVAFGGGEPLDLPWIFELAAHARLRKLTPSLTTAGLSMTAGLARACRVFAQVNVSLDADYEQVRGFDGGPRALAALKLLRAELPSVGLNCVVTRHNFESLNETLRLARSLRLNQVQLLRLKPVGREAAQEDRTLTLEQAEALWPRVAWLSLRHRMRVRLDCSFGPMVFHHRPPRALMELFGVVGCAGGDELIAVRPDGAVTGCGFHGAPEADVRDGAALGEAFATGFKQFRDFARAPPEPCASCSYVSLCRGGCRAASPNDGLVRADPGCPRVARWNSQRSPQ